MKKRHTKYTIFFLLFAIIVAGCATYYKKTLKFQEQVQSGDFEKAKKWLENKSKDKKGKNKVLYYLNSGYVNFMLKNFQQSNQDFQTADILIEDYMKNLGKEALALITNPSIKPYRPEDFEIVMLNYFTSLNYINLKEYQEAIVECKRINIKLNDLNDKYKDHKNRYQRDAFAHTLMGLIYEANNDYNNAFIAYRNAYEVYAEDYNKLFGISAPSQLKHDLLRTAYLTGFYDEVRYYEKKFNMKYKHNASNNPTLVFFWLNGFGPVKSEWSVMLSKSSYNNGYITFVNEEMNLNFRYYVGNRSSDEKSGFSDLSFVRIAFPKYRERPPLFKNGYILHDNKKYNLEIVQDINKIAFKTLRDRMLREVGNSLLRVASKKALEKIVEQQNKNLGTAVSIANALTEKADTRNWQTLPYAIYYTKIPLKTGNNTINLSVKTKQGNQKSYDFDFDAQKGKMYFHTFHNIETLPPRP